MPGPKMGPRPPDFDEDDIRKSPTFRKWMELPIGRSLRYACRDFIKGQPDDEERLMRRIMIARRNNLKEHTVLKRARLLVSYQKRQLKGGEKQKAADTEDMLLDDSETRTDEPNDGNCLDSNQSSHAYQSDADHSSSERNRRHSTVFSDAEIAREMDVSAVLSTRSYRAWLALPDGAEFQYNQKYMKGRDGHDWLLRKNIWRRMRYRRKNKKMVDELVPRKKRSVSVVKNTEASREKEAEVENKDEMSVTVMNMNDGVSKASEIVDQALLSTTTAVTPDLNTASKQPPHPESTPLQNNTAEEPSASIPDDPGTAAVVEAAVFAGESYAINQYNVHNPLDNAAVDHHSPGLGLALDAAARLAAVLKTEEADLEATAVVGQQQQQHHHHLMQPQQTVLIEPYRNNFPPIKTEQESD